MQKHKLRKVITLILWVCFLLIPISVEANIPPGSYGIEHSTHPKHAPEAWLLQISNNPPQVNAPFFEGDIRYPETAIFWFGRLTPTENFSDVRVGYNQTELFVSIATFDRRLWYDPDPSPSYLTSYDSATLYLDLDGNSGASPDTNSHKFVGSLYWWESPENYRIAYRGDGVDWTVSDATFLATSGWRGDAPNNSGDDRGWVLTYRIPFSSLGLEGPPPEGTIWGFAVEMHDRDDATGSPIQTKTWPITLDTISPDSWGRLGFSLPDYTPPPATSAGTVIVRDGHNGVSVPDAAVGGGTVCGEGLDFWHAWGEENYAGYTEFNIQNQSDVADWPCFSKYYVNFPLDQMPPGAVILSATLTLHQMGSSQGPGTADPSLIQILTVDQSWQETTITWNNAPLASQNFSSAWVNPVSGFPGWPGIPWSWDVTAAVANAYESMDRLNLAIYSADSGYHSGKYFVTSDTGDWNEIARPTLEIEWGYPDDGRIFEDVPPDHWAHDYISALYQGGYVAGCSIEPRLYCPESILTRAESAVFVLRGQHGAIPDPPYAPPATPTFADVATDFWGYGWIESLWTDGFTAGCGTDPLIYCPLQQHTRAEGSVFFTRIKNGVDYEPPAPLGIFDDVALDAWYAGWVEAAYNEGILPACDTDPLRFCPEAELDRSWAAYMMVQAKEITLP